MDRNSYGYKSLHKWVGKNKTKPKCCEICGEEKDKNGNIKLELANISGEYKWNINDFEYAHRKCHRQKYHSGDNISPEERKNRSESKKGKNNPMFDKHLSEAHKRKLSESLKGEKHPFYNKPLSEDHKRKISESMKGEKHPMYGKHPSDETRRKMSEAHKGKKHTLEAKKKMSESHKKYNIKKQNI